MFFTGFYRDPKPQATTFVRELTTYHFLPTLAQPQSRILFPECYSLICIDQFYLANDNVYVLYISCIFFVML